MGLIDLIPARSDVSKLDSARELAAFFSSILARDYARSIRISV